MKTASITLLALLSLTGCAGSLKSNFETDEAEFPFILLSQSGSLIPGVQKQVEKSSTNDNSVGDSSLKKHQTSLSDIRNYSITITQGNLPRFEKNEAYNKKIELSKDFWRSNIERVSIKISETQSHHLLRRRQYEQRSDVLNVPILGGLIAIATSAFFKSSTESVGGIAAGVGGLTASRDYFNVENKRDLHLRAAVGMSCILNEANLLYGKAENIATINRAIDDLKDASELAQRAVSSLGRQGNLTDNDKDTIAVFRTSLDAAKKAEALGNKQISGFENMPYQMLVTASDLQKSILVDGGRGKVESGKITDAVKVQLKEAASATNEIVTLREKLAEAKGGKLTVDDPNAANSKKNLPQTRVADVNSVTDSQALEKQASLPEAYAALVRTTEDVLNAVSLLGEEGEMNQVQSRITNCGAGLGKSGG